MGSYSMFKGNEYDGKTGAQVQQTGQKIKQKFDIKRSRYHQLRNQLDLGDGWDELNEAIINFDQEEFTPWNQKWNDIYRSSDINKHKIFFSEGASLFEEMDVSLRRFTVSKNHSEDVENLKGEILKQVETDVLNLKADISIQIEQGIKDLVGLKAEMGLQKNFQENIENELSKSTKYRIIFLILFICSIVFIPTFLFSTFLHPTFETISYSDLMLMRFGVTFSAAILSYFLYTQYRLYQVICLRYSHLHGFLGGGATFINQIIESEDETKSDINKKMAELFMELDDVFGLVKKNQHPVEMSLDKAGDIVDKVGDIASKLSKN